MSTSDAVLPLLSEPARELYVRSCRRHQSGKTPVFENDTCGRCGGTGRMPYSVYSGRCFRCHGRGFLLTKRGAAANAHLEALRSVPASSLKVGDVVRYEFLVNPFSADFVRAFADVTKVEVLPDGQIAYEVRSPGYGDGSAVTGASALVRVAQTREQKLATLVQALEYQATLTKAGTVRKAAKQAS